MTDGVIPYRRIPMTGSGSGPVSKEWLQCCCLLWLTTLSPFLPQRLEWLMHSDTEVLIPRRTPGQSEPVWTAGFLPGNVLIRSTNVHMPSTYIQFNSSIRDKNVCCFGLEVSRWEEIIPVILFLVLVGVLVCLTNTKQNDSANIKNSRPNFKKK